MNVDYSKYYYCTTCREKILISKCLEGNNFTTCPLGHRVRKHRRRIITDFIERRNKKDMIELCKEYLSINERGKLLVEDIQDFADEFLFEDYS